LIVAESAKKKQEKTVLIAPSSIKKAYAFQGGLHIAGLGGTRLLRVCADAQTEKM